MEKKEAEVTVHDGQCALCAHFGTHDGAMKELGKVRKTHRASLGLVKECEHPTHAPLHLKVNATSGCDGFTPAPM